MRLERKYAESNEYYEESFQFHKGAIRTFTSKMAKPHFRNFNSIKVRLEQSTEQLVDYLRRFQFHKGAIRT